MAGDYTRLMSPTRRLLAYVGRYRGAFILGFVCIVATTAISLAGPWVLKYAIDDLTKTGITAAKLRFYGGAILGLAAVGGIFRFLQRRVVIGASRDIELDLRNDFFARLQLFEPAYFHRNRTGDLMSRATNDLNAVRMMIGPAVMYLSNTVLTFIAVIVLMLSLNVRLTLLSLIPLPILSVAVIGGVWGGAWWSSAVCCARSWQWRWAASGMRVRGVRAAAPPSAVAGTPQRGCKPQPTGAADRFREPTFMKRAECQNAKF